MARDRLAEEAWEALARAQIALMRRFQDDFRGWEVTMREYDVLFTLSRCPKGTRLRDLSEHVLLTQPSISRLVERMAESGLVSREGDPTDRRGTIVGLTERGREVLRRVGRAHAAAIRDYVGTALTPDELRALRDIALKLRRAQSRAQG
ncbi:MarR family winged helix-turn-helix transcriptional regulator [Streptomonospora nanhaiensis]|uniref:MarR family winged helix-turn-helix transcriptional regulator n=1 Tax=Streptomonospora nanhaiensis TaxID=1323731 RepID=UPI001C386CDD|nr:MarR family transcriptional regulator [Streptomonospora nanhaiensis]MBV2366315.1 MarR family transcriptional regulator [Streptomonospora nanhaiensis]MBX9387931.1 MarR family transcriptional regulator [Streptomonospora nanhaiensis]